MSPSTYDYDSIPVGYYDEIFRRKQGMQSKWHHLKFKRVREEFPAKGLHIDVACGPGTLIGTVPASVTSTGLDISAPQIEYAGKHYSAPGRDFRLMQPGVLELPDDAADVVTSIELIEHIDEPEALRLMRECRRVLRAGGKLIVTTPNYGFLWPAIEFFLNRLGKVSYQDQHITKYTPKRLRSLLLASGFTSVKVETCLWSAPFAAALGWDFADTVDRLEPDFLQRRFGHLLIAVAHKQ